MSLQAYISREADSSIFGEAEHKEKRMTRVKLVLVAILLAAALLIPDFGQADSYCPTGCALCHPASTQCCKWVGGRFLKC
jgi:hypothetical protein